VLDNVAEIALGDSHTCALRLDGTVSCWGSNTNGEVGVGYPKDSLSPVPVPTLNHVTDIALGFHDSCVRLETGGVFCWGDNAYGKLGIGGNIDAHQATWVSAGFGYAKEVGLGQAHSCALKADGSVFCWGYNGNSHLGNGAGPDQDVPIQVDNLLGVTEVAVGKFHTCTRKTSGEVQCWGQGSEGQLGNGTHFDEGKPTPVMW
jgi:alpha-tubulin suppressor-like RCC1 family protein